jgi:hypothetical protein
MLAVSAQRLGRALAILCQGTHLLQQRAADLLPDDGIQPRGVLAQSLQRRGGECLLRLCGLHQ